MRRVKIRLSFQKNEFDRSARKEVQRVPVVYGELHSLVRRYMKRERPGHSLQTTALVNEAYMRLMGYKRMQWQNRAHFFAVSAQVMRRILRRPPSRASPVDRARTSRRPFP